MPFVREGRRVGVGRARRRGRWHFGGGASSRATGPGMTPEAAPERGSRHPGLGRWVWDSCLLLCRQGPKTLVEGGVVVSRVPSPRRARTTSVAAPRGAPDAAMADEVIWVQCDSCSKWRKMPHITNADTLRLNWFCWLNPDKRYASCPPPRRWRGGAARAAAAPPRAPAARREEEEPRNARAADAAPAIDQAIAGLGGLADAIARPYAATGAACRRARRGASAPPLSELEAAARLIDARFVPCARLFARCASARPRATSSSGCASAAVQAGVRARVPRARVCLRRADDATGAAAGAPAARRARSRPAEGALRLARATRAARVRGRDARAARRGCAAGSRCTGAGATSPSARRALRGRPGRRCAATHAALARARASRATR